MMKELLIIFRLGIRKSEKLYKNEKYCMRHHEKKDDLRNNVVIQALLYVKKKGEAIILHFLVVA